MSEALCLESTLVARTFENTCMFIEERRESQTLSRENKNPEIVQMSGSVCALYSNSEWTFYLTIIHPTPNVMCLISKVHPTTPPLLKTQRIYVLLQESSKILVALIIMLSILTPALRNNQRKQRAPRDLQECSVGKKPGYNLTIGKEAAQETPS